MIVNINHTKFKRNSRLIKGLSLYDKRIPYNQNQNIRSYTIPKEKGKLILNNKNLNNLKFVNFSFYQSNCTIFPLIWQLKHYSININPDNNNCQYKIKLTNLLGSFIIHGQSEKSILINENSIYYWEALNIYCSDWFEKKNILKAWKCFENEAKYFDHKICTIFNDKSRKRKDFIGKDEINFNELQLKLIFLIKNFLIYGKKENGGRNWIFIQNLNNFLKFKIQLTNYNEFIKFRKKKINILSKIIDIDWFYHLHKNYYNNFGEYLFGNSYLNLILRRGNAKYDIFNFNSLNSFKTVYFQKKKIHKLHSQEEIVKKEISKKKKDDEDILSIFSSELSSPARLKHSSFYFEELKKSNKNYDKQSLTKKSLFFKDGKNIYLYKIFLFKNLNSYSLNICILNF